MNLLDFEASGCSSPRSEVYELKSARFGIQVRRVECMAWFRV